jgi:hypothetical protein
MRSIGRSLKRHKVDYLLISGQASVLYGAAEFSEDLDLWVRPTRENLRRLLRALVSLRARYHKLTPPVSLRNALRGHGFHFLLPGRPPLYLDVMGCPPRLPAFSVCRRRALILSTPWGPMPVLMIEDLAEIKKTRRLGDYDVITALARIRLEREDHPSPAALRWAVRNTFRPEGLDWIRSRFPGTSMPRGAAASHLGLARRLAGLQKSDARYWRPILAEIRRMWQDDRLMPEGERVE